MLRWVVGIDRLGGGSPPQEGAAGLHLGAHSRSRARQNYVMVSAWESVSDRKYSAGPAAPTAAHAPPEPRTARPGLTDGGCFRRWRHRRLKSADSPPSPVGSKTFPQGRGEIATK